MSNLVPANAHGFELAERPRDYQGLTMAVAPAEALRRVQELQAFVTTVMVRDLDFGVIPGTGDKPTLLQPGAQKLAEIYGLAHSFSVIEQVKDWERGFFYFEYKCAIVSRRDGSHVADGIGSCNSRESKYAGRWAFESEVPKGLDLTKLPQRKGKSKKPPYREYTMYRVPNDDPYSLVNTIQKMAAKRAYIHAIVSATRSAGVFTQDVEDLPREVFGEAEAERSWDQAEREQTSEALSGPNEAGRARDNAKNRGTIAGMGSGEPAPSPPHDPETGEVRYSPVQQEINALAEKYKTPATGPSPAQSARMAQRERELIVCGTPQALAAVWRAINADRKTGALTLTQAAELGNVKDRCKKNMDDAITAELERSNDVGDLDPGGLGPGPQS